MCSSCAGSRCDERGSVGVTNQYRWVQWNRHKRVYDLVLAGVVVAYLVAFVGSH